MTPRRAADEPSHHSVPSAGLGTGLGTLDLIAGELARARRHERPFSVLHISPAGTLNGSTEHAALEIRSSLRECDRMETDGSGIAILLTETDAVGAISCVERIAASIGIEARLVRRASFPDDGVTSGALCALLEGRVDELPAPSDLPTGRGSDVVASSLH
ncbi:MAG: hypothetical protein ACN4IE_16675 [Ilumatobacter sp.]